MNEPAVQHRFLPTRDTYGSRLGLVFGNEAPDGICPFIHANQCHHCDIGLGEGREFNTEQNLSRLSWFREYYVSVWSDLRHLVIYNSGSTLNPSEMSPSTWGGIARFAAGLPQLDVVSLDTRETFVREDRLLRIAEQLPDQVRTRPILGIETIDDNERMQLLEKSMSRSAILRALDVIAAASVTCPMGVDANVLIGGPVSLKQGARPVDNAVATAHFVVEACQARGLDADLNLHPYYPSRRGLARFPDLGRCSWNVVRDTVTTIAASAWWSENCGQMFIGWQDEGHDQQPAARQEEANANQAMIETFNTTQDAAAFTA